MDSEIRLILRPNMSIDPQQLTWKTYRRPFTTPLPTAKGVLREREGVLLRYPMKKEKNSYEYSEIAPWPDFGTETVEEVTAYLEQSQEEGMFKKGERSLPATEFGLWSLANPMSDSKGPKVFENTYLASASRNLSEQAMRAEGEGYLSQKWKIGIDSWRYEMRWVASAISRLEITKQIRLDANQNLSRSDWKEWTHFLDDQPAVTFVEEPCEFPQGGIGELMNLYEPSAGRVALDESINDIENLQYLVDQNWQGYVVVKPAILGNPEHWMELLKGKEERLVFSSVFETAIGVGRVLDLAARLNLKTALGLGTLAYFDGDGLSPAMAPILVTGSVVENNYEFSSVWDKL